MAGRRTGAGVAALTFPSALIAGIAWQQKCSELLAFSADFWQIPSPGRERKSLAADCLRGQPANCERAMRRRASAPRRTHEFAILVRPLARAGSAGQSGACAFGAHARDAASPGCRRRARPPHRPQWSSDKPRPPSRRRAVNDRRAPMRREGRRQRRSDISSADLRERCGRRERYRQGKYSREGLHHGILLYSAGKPGAERGGSAVSNRLPECGSSGLCSPIECAPIDGATVAFPLARSPDPPTSQPSRCSVGRPRAARSGVQIRLPTDLSSRQVQKAGLAGFEADQKARAG